MSSESIKVGSLYDGMKLSKLLQTRIDHQPIQREGKARQWCYVLNAKLNFLIEFRLDAPARLNDVRICIVPLLLASSSTWNHREVIVAIHAPGYESSLEINTALGLLCRRVLRALKAYQKERPDNGAFHRSPKVWVNESGQVEEVVTQEALPSDNMTTHVFLDSTIRHLEWAVRHWQMDGVLWQRSAGHMMG